MRLPRQAQSEFYRIFRYGLVGLANTAVTALAIIILAKMGLHYVVYTILGYIVGIIVSFTLNTIFTFRKTGQSILPMLAKFIATSLFLVATVQLLQLGLIEGLGWSEFFAVSSGMLFYTSVGYIINRLWVFL